ncbi:MAG: peptidase M48 [Bacteroidetes bacterium]|nr:MAG: peptidase M48 [Bacteroidota bacterium]REK07603.1 MAG: peptidase M48 [Bacteroidota bacterium]REK36965.1 MAG: peptidase M48 [Bacteroidota bacterium]REK47785.1 MAG: peptidase M48 [Bacteroidota bacterium]
MVVFRTAYQLNLQKVKMKKALFHLIVLLALFFTTWFLLSRISFTTHFNLKEFSREQENKIGELIWDFFRQTEKEIKNDSIRVMLDDLMTRIGTANDIDSDSIKLHILSSSEVNAFALPGNRVVIFQGLIRDCENPEELAGVICHELAHLEMDHIMQRLMREIGLGIILSAGGGNAGTEIIRQAAKLATSTAFDRAQESEADSIAVIYLNKALIDPVPFSDFMKRQSENDHEYSKSLEWISTHPDSKIRAERIRKMQSKNKNEYKALMSLEQWNRFRELSLQSN